MPKPKDEVRIGLAVQAHFLGRVEDRLVQIRRGPAEGDAVAGLHGDAVDLGVHRADAADVRERHEDAEELLARVDDALRILPQILQRLGMVGQIGRVRRRWCG